MQTAAGERRAIPGPFRLFLAVNAGATVLCGLVEVWCRLVLKLHGTYVNPFFIGYRFGDFECFQRLFVRLHHANFYYFDQPFVFSYPAPASLIYAGFYWFDSFGYENLALDVFLGCTAASFLVMTILVGRALYRAGLHAWAAAGCATLMLASAFPLWFVFQRANIEIVVMLLVAGGVWAFCVRRGYWAAVLFGLAAALKIVPVLYFGLLLARREWKQVTVGIVVWAAATLGGLWFLGPTIAMAWHGLAAGMAAFHQDFLMHFDPNGIGFDHTVLGVYRRFFAVGPELETVISRTTLTCAVLGTVLYFARIVRLPVANQLLCLTIAAVWLPPVSFEYTLVHLYAGIVVLILAAIRGVRGLTVPMVLLALLVSPLSEFIWGGMRFGGQIKSVLLGVLFCWALVRPMRTQFDHAHSHAQEHHESMVIF